MTKESDRGLPEEQVERETSLDNGACDGLPWVFVHVGDGGEAMLGCVSCSRCGARDRIEPRPTTVEKWQSFVLDFEDKHASCTPREAARS